MYSPRVRDIVSSNPVGSNQRLINLAICCFSAEHTALRRKSKDWLARTLNNVSVSNATTCLTADGCFREVALWKSK